MFFGVDNQLIIEMIAKRMPFFCKKTYSGVYRNDTELKGYW